MSPWVVFRFAPSRRPDQAVARRLVRAAKSTQQTARDAGSWMLLGILGWITLAVVGEYGVGPKATTLLLILYAVSYVFWRVLRVALVVVLVIALLGALNPGATQQAGLTTAGVACAPTGPTISAVSAGHRTGGFLRQINDGDSGGFTVQQVQAGGRRAWDTAWPEVAKLIRLEDLRAGYDAAWDGQDVPPQTSTTTPAGFADCAPGTIPAVLPGPVGACPPTGLPQERRLRPNALRGLRCTVATFRITDIGGFATKGHVAGSDHYSGNAIDVMIAGWQTPAGNARGLQVARWFEAHAQQLGVKYVIFDRRAWRLGGGWRPYTRGAGDPNLEHRNHVHVSFLSGAVATVPAVQASYVGGPQ